jgi:hypothetical protein
MAMQLSPKGDSFGNERHVETTITLQPMFMRLLAVVHKTRLAKCEPAQTFRGTIVAIVSSPSISAPF